MALRDDFAVFKQLSFLAALAGIVGLIVSIWLVLIYVQS